MAHRHALRLLLPAEQQDLLTGEGVGVMTLDFVFRRWLFVSGGRFMGSPELSKLGLPWRAADALLWHRLTKLGADVLPMQ